MTVREVLQMTIQGLNGVCVPVGLMESVGKPIQNAVLNMEACIEAIDRDEGGEEDGNADAD